MKEIGITQIYFLDSDNHDSRRNPFAIDQPNLENIEHDLITIGGI